MRVVFVLPLLLLTACGFESPTWLPASYARLNEEYKAQPGPEAETLGYPYTAARNEYMVTMWSSVVRELIDAMETKTGLSSGAVYIEQLPETTAFNLSLDNALREELTDRHYTLVDEPAGNLHIRYQAFEPQDEKKRLEIPYNGDEKKSLKPYAPEKPRTFVFVLTLLQDGTPFGEVRTQHTMPAYGYESGKGNIVPAQRIMEGRVNE